MYLNFMKRGWFSMKRRPGKVLILGALLFVLGNVVAGALFIQQAVANTESNLLAQLPPVAILDMDHQEAQQYFWQTGEHPPISRLTPSLVEEIAEMTEVMAFDFTSRISLLARELVRAPFPQELLGDLPDGITPEQVEANDWLSLGFVDVDHIERFHVMGVMNPELLLIQGGALSLLEGRTFTQAEIDGGAKKAVVPESFAQGNGLTIGSMMTLESNVYDTSSLPPSMGISEAGRFDDEILYFSEEIQLEVIGIFQVLQTFDLGTEDDFWGANAAIRELHNAIYIPSSLAEDLFLRNNEARQSILESWEIGELVQTATFVLEDSRDLAAFAESVQESLPDFWLVSYWDEAFSAMGGSMETMLWIADLIFWAAAGTTVLVTSLLVMLFLRDRQKEIGIYLALGEKKIKILTQILLEVLVVSLAAISLSVFSGSFLAGGISRQMMEADLIRQQEEIQADSGLAVGSIHGIALELFNPGEMDADQMMAAFETGMDAGDLVLFAGFGMGTVGLSTLVPIVYLLTLKPKKIML